METIFFEAVRSTYSAANLLASKLRTNGIQCSVKEYRSNFRDVRTKYIVTGTVARDSKLISKFKLNID